MLSFSKSDYRLRIFYAINAVTKQEKQNIFYRDEQDIQDKIKIVLWLIAKFFILFILSIPVNLSISIIRMPSGTP